MTITQKSPKQFRFSLIGRLQNYTLDIIEELYFANDIFIKPENKSALIQRREHQRKAMSRLKLLVYVAQVSMEQGAIQPKQYEQICRHAYDTLNMLGAWMNSDLRRYTATKEKKI